MNQDRTEYYLPILNPDLILEGCETLLKTLVERIIEKYINGGRINYTDEANVIRVKVRQIVIDFLD